MFFRLRPHWSKILQLGVTSSTSVAEESPSTCKFTHVYLMDSSSLTNEPAHDQSNQSLRCALNGKLRTQGFLIRTAKTRIRLGRCPGWSESSLSAQVILFCHAVAQIGWVHLSVKRCLVCFVLYLSRLMTKPTKWHVRPAKTQISLGIRPVWSEFAVCSMDS